MHQMMYMHEKMEQTLSQIALACTLHIYDFNERRY